MGIYCAILGCVGSYDSKHRFPNPEKYPELFKKWILICGRPELLVRSPKKVYDNCRVCQKHFTEDSFGRNNRLLSTAYPNIHVPELQKVDARPDTEVATTFSCDPYDNPTSIYSGISDSQNQSTEYKQASSDVASTSGINRMDIGVSELKITTVEEVSYPVTETPRKADQRENILHLIGKQKVSDLSPKSKILYKHAYTVRRKLSAKSRAHQMLKKKLFLSKQKPKKLMFDDITSSMDRIRKRFFESQLENRSKLPKGRRYTTDDKILAIALQKQSGSGYKFLSSIFNLPSRRTLQRVLDNVAIKPGVNNACFELFKSAEFKQEQDKYCILIFDEMSIGAHLQYNVKEDIVEGFENYGYRVSNKIANHVQVFMLRGIKHKWKQPVYFNTVNGATKAADITRIIKLVVAEAQNAGLVIVATVCDQNTTNVSAIKSLISTTRASNIKEGIDCIDPVFKVNDMTIIPLFDTPHLIKGIRNNLLKHNLCFETNSQRKVAKWDHIHTAYKMDGYIGNIRSMPRITDYHVNPDVIKKMKVSYCTQVFSNSVAKAINLMAFSETCVQIENETMMLPKEAMQTAECCEFFDGLFDSLNGSTLTSKKPWRKAVTSQSGHIPYWNQCIQVLKTMYFTNNAGEKVRQPPSLENFITTLENFKILVSRLRKIGFQHIMPRTFNQDPIENFFGRIRQRSYRFTNPTVSSFIVLYKSLLVNNITGKHPSGGNCEDDKSSVFFTLKNLLTQTSETPEEKIIREFEIPQRIATSPSMLLKQVLSYMSGFIVRKISSLRNCDECKKYLLTDHITSDYDFTKSKEYHTTPRLLYVNKDIIDVITKCYHIILYMLNVYIHSPDLRKRITVTLLNRIRFPHCCSHHGGDIKTKILGTLINVLIHNYLKQINNIVIGKDLRKVTSHDPIVFQNARALYLKTRKR